MVPGGRILLFAEYRNDGAVQIEDQPGPASGPVDEILQQSVVAAMQLLPESVRCVE